MVPHTYPSTVDATTSNRQMVAYSLPSISGLVRWVDYIPIKISTGPVSAANTYNNDGYIPIDFLSSTTGKTAWIDYIPVYVDTAATDSWQISSNGFIPYAVLGTAPSIADDYYKYVSLLANTTSTNGAQNNTFLDGSTNAFSVTRNGNTTQGNFSPFSQTGWSNFFDGTGDYLSVADNVALEPGTGDFCLEIWVYFNALTIGNIYNAQQQGPSLALDGSNQFSFGQSYVSTLLTDTVAATTGQWYHVAVCRSGTTLSMFVNGSRRATATNSTNFNTTVANYIGWNGVSAYFNGYLSNLRLVKGSAVYDPTLTTLTVPTAPLTAISGTSLLTCQSNRFIDNSSNAFAITRNGDVSVQAFSPFNPTAAWSASTNGGSGYFDGNGDSLQLADNAVFEFGSGDFTLEAWIRPTAYATLNSGQYNSDIISKDQTSLREFGFYISGTASSYTAINFIGFSNNTTFTTITGTQAFDLGVWYHVAAVRSGNNVYLYVNGVQVNSTTAFSQTIQDTASVVYIGARNFDASNQYYFPGYISNLRVVKGTAVYTANFTPPTAPLTAITNTSLLLNFTNAGIYDSASGNDLETVGNAQVSTVQAKWGTTSMAFDGTGDWLIAPDRLPLRLGTAAFTIEGWFNLESISLPLSLLGKGTSTTGWNIAIDASGYLTFTHGTTTITGTTTAVPVFSWAHFAIVRTGTGANQTSIYLNGTLVGQGTVATDFNQTNPLYVGASRTATQPFVGYIDDLRITNGYARYTANFTPPTAAFPTN